MWVRRPGMSWEFRIQACGAEETDMAGLVQVVRERLARADDKRPWVRGSRGRDL